MKNILLLLLLLGTSHIGFSQVITIKNQETGEPIPYAALKSEKLKVYVLTNAEGQAEISAFEGETSIEIYSHGYKTTILSYNDLASFSFELMLMPSSINLDEVVISATRWSQTSSNVPHRITSISPEDVSLLNPQTAADLLGSSGKVFIQKSQQGGGSPIIRGFATNRLLYTVDGVRMNTAIFRGGNIQNVISLDPFATENTEVFFGPGSVIYGSDAIGGVMSFKTLTPQLSVKDKPLINGKAVARYSSANNEKTGHFDVNVGWRKWAMVTSFSSNDYGDLRMGAHGPDEYLRPYYVQRQNDVDVVITNDDPRIQRPSGYSQMNMMQKVRFSPNDRWDIQYGFHFSETSDYARYDRHLRTRDGAPRYGEWAYGPQKWMMNNLNIAYSQERGLFDEVTLRLAHQFFEESRMSRNINRTNREIRMEEVDAYSANLDFVKNIGSQHTLYYGFEAISNKVSSTGIDEDISTDLRTLGPSRYPEAIWTSYSAYFSTESKIAKDITLHTGLRYNQFMLDATFDTAFYPFPFSSANQNDGALTGSIGAIFKPSRFWVVSTNFATAFRAPNVDDIGKVFDSEPGAVVVPNPDLKAEYAYNADVNVARVFGESVKIDFSAYYTILQNAMVRRDYMLNDRDSIVYDGILSQVQAIQNAATAYVYGVQAGIEIQLPQNFRFSSDINFQKGEEELDSGVKSPSRHAPPWFGSSRLTYAFNRLRLQFYAIYSGERSFEDMPIDERRKTEIYAQDGNGNPYAPAWYTLNVKAMYRFADKSSISAGLENLTDQRYRPYSSGIVAPGRNFILSLQTRF